ncbi:MAG: hypothetical protein ACI97A_001008 [Planctomycetota bacterium]|jgi:hypothetical protein
MASRLQLAIVLFMATWTMACSDGDQSKSDDTRTSVLPAKAALNGVDLKEQKDGPFSFFTVGHIYGEPGRQFKRPAPSFVAGKPHLKALDPKFGVLLGDIFYLWKPKEMAATLGHLAEFPFPIVNAVGNHDVVVRDKWSSKFGPTYFAFSYANSRFVILDTEIDPWNISGEQLEFFKNEMELCEGPNKPKNLFIFVHKVVWAGTKETIVCAYGCNSPESLGIYVEKPDSWPTFNRQIRPRLREISKSVPTYFFGGDLGAFSAVIHLFQQEDTKIPGTQLTYLGAGIGDRDRDAVIVVDVDAKGKATLSGMELKTGKKVDLTPYDSAYWVPKFFKDNEIPEVILPYLEK